MLHEANLIRAHFVFEHFDRIMCRVQRVSSTLNGDWARQSDEQSQVRQCHSTVVVVSRDRKSVV